jgi:outer membrane receptor for ferrienterochelin and colicin
LRGEYSDRILEQKLKNENYIYQKLHFFPSFSILKSLGEKVQLQLSYSRRISRPIDFHLNPFPSTFSSSVISIGNPELQPDFPNSFEFNITSDFNLFTLNINNFYIYTENATTQVISLNNNGTQVLTFENMNFNRFIGSEISTTFTLLKVLKLSPSANIYSMESKGKIDDYDANYKTLTFDLSLNGTLKINKSTKFQLVTTYSGKSVTQQGYMFPNYFLTASLNQDFFAEKLSITLQARNLFNSNHIKFDEFGQNFNTKLDYRLETNIFTINVSYKFNNFKKNALMQGKTIDNEI